LRHAEKKSIIRRKKIRCKKIFGAVMHNICKEIKNIKLIIVYETLKVEFAEFWREKLSIDHKT